MLPHEKTRINLIGQAGSGKSTISQHLAEHFGFEIFRPSDVIREYAQARDIALKRRQDYVDVHQAMMDEDPDMIVRPVLQSPAARLCIDGLRVPHHAEILQRQVGMVTLALACPVETRFDRVYNASEWRRYREESQVKTLEEFTADEAADNDNTDPLLPNVVTIMRMAGTTIDASQPLEVVLRQTELFLGSTIAT